MSLFDLSNRANLILKKCVVQSSRRPAQRASRHGARDQLLRRSLACSTGAQQQRLAWGQGGNSARRRELHAHVCACCPPAAPAPPTARYEKYDASFEPDKNSSGDPFMDEYNEVEAEVDKLMEVRAAHGGPAGQAGPTQRPASGCCWRPVRAQAAADVQLEHSRSVVAQKNAEIRCVSGGAVADAGAKALQGACSAHTCAACVCPTLCCAGPQASQAGAADGGSGRPAQKGQEGQGRQQANHRRAARAGERTWLTSVRMMQEYGTSRLLVTRSGVSVARARRFKPSLRRSRPSPTA